MSYKCYHYKKTCSDLFGPDSMLQGHDCCFSYCDNKKRKIESAKVINKLQKTTFFNKEKETKITIIGDYGHPTPCEKNTPQYQILQSMPISSDFIISVGDNAYSHETIVDKLDNSDVSDDKIAIVRGDRENFMIKESLQYLPKDVPILSAIGNHEYNHSKPSDPCRVLEQINYSYDNNNWFMLDRYWSIKSTLKPSKFNFEIDKYIVKYIFIDTSEILFMYGGNFNKKISKKKSCNVSNSLFLKFIDHYDIKSWKGKLESKQYEWLIQELMEAIVSSQIVILIGHHPIELTLVENDQYHLQRLKKGGLDPLIKLIECYNKRQYPFDDVEKTIITSKIALYICGHVHNLQFNYTERLQLYSILSGSGGCELDDMDVFREIKTDKNMFLFDYGYVELTIRNDDTMLVEFKILNKTYETKELIFGNNQVNVNYITDGIRIPDYNEFSLTLNINSLQLTKDSILVLKLIKLLEKINLLERFIRLEICKDNPTLSELAKKICKKFCKKKERLIGKVKLRHYNIGKYFPLELF